jgi:two-component system invasion response regulator UvrY
MIKVILVDDHTLILRGLRELLSAAPGIAVVGEAVDYASLRTLVRDTHPDVVVLDINLPGRSGLDALASLNELEPAPKVLMLSQFAADQYGLRALRAGAMGYLNKSCDPALIVEAVREIAGGRKYVTSELANLLLDAVTGNTPALLHETLSEREMQVLLLIAGGKRLSVIAERLVLSPKTVSVYRARILEKLSLASNAELAAYALRHHLIE